MRLLIGCATDSEEKFNKTSMQWHSEWGQMGQTAPGGNLEVRQNGGDNGKNGGDKGASGILRLLGAAKLQSTLGTDNPR